MNSKYYLKIFQLEAYRPTRFIRWIARNYVSMVSKSAGNLAEEPVWTPKAKLLYRLAVILGVVLVFWLLQCSLIGAFLLAFGLYFNFYLLLLLAWCLIRPYELVNRIRVKGLIKSKILSLTELRVIGITGSFGKTSTKMVLNQLLPNSLMTPKSYNTLFGIWKVVDYELSDHFRCFICEMGAYKQGDVQEFCELTMPHIGLLTGINEQHLERFGSIENTIKAKFEITQHLRSGGTAIVNLDNAHVRKHLNLSTAPLIGYSIDGFSEEKCLYVVSVSDWRVEDFQMHFTIQYKGEAFNASTALIGRAHLSNILAAFTTATFCGQQPEAVLRAVATLRQVPHRLECRRSEGYTLLDNSYSSNPNGFRDSIDALSRFSGHKVLITPGLVELGAETEQVHQELGRLAATVCDEIVLVGDTDKTRALKKGISESDFSIDKIQTLKNRDEMLEYLRTKAHSGQVVLLENDLPDQYL